ncbi:MAG TPA: ATP-grasp domain-containing protein [Candidatus Nanoarchaeia archaeon]|nr:ATP-grasp domain-containing protein [Candidatus Nanoarchaeia archaeon]
MKLYEYEGKELLKKYGIAVPNSVLYYKDDKIQFQSLIIKAQTLSGGRGKAGLVRTCSKDEVKEIVEEMKGKLHNFELVEKILIEEKIEPKKEFYIAITYDTDLRSAIIAFSQHGGIEVNKFASTVHKFQIFPNEKLDYEELLRKAAIKNDKNEWKDFLSKVVKCFLEEDCRLLEINPVALTKEGKLIALDAMVDLEDEAFFRHQDRKYEPRQAGFGRAPTERELKVKEVNTKDYRGTVKYLELDGDIGFLAAGGGGSIACMDALTGIGGRPANFTEFSGNPSDEKVYELTKIILSKPGLNGLWIVGAIANFTLMDTTMSGVIKALEEVKPQFPIVVRRSGPHEKEGLEILRRAKEELNLDMTVHGAEMPMTKTAIIIKEKAEQYGDTNRR